MFLKPKRRTHLAAVSAGETRQEVLDHLKQKPDINHNNTKFLHKSQHSILSHKTSVIARFASIL